MKAQERPRGARVMEKTLEEVVNHVIPRKLHLILESFR